MTPMKRALPLLLSLVFALTLAAQQTESQKLHKLFDDDWEWSMLDNPEGATYVGDPRGADRLNERTPEAFERRRAHDRELLGRIQAIDRSKLSEDDRLNYDLFLLQVRDSLDGDRFQYELMPLGARGGVFEELSELAQGIPR